MIRSILLVLGVWTSASLVISPLLGRRLRIVRHVPEVAPAQLDLVAPPPEMTPTPDGVRTPA